MEIASLDTPVATVDLDAVERNIARMQGYCDEHGLAFRPHIKTHKLPAIAHMQLRAGAVGITCQKLGEAEVMEAAGLRDILLSFPLVGAAKAERLAALAGEAAISVVGDSAAVARGLSPALAARGRRGRLPRRVRHRLRAAPACRRPRRRPSSPSSPTRCRACASTGLMTYPTLPETGAWLRAARRGDRGAGPSRRAGQRGRDADVRSSTTSVGEVTEVRAGTYVYGDRSCIANGSVPLDDCALRVRATVVSRPTPDRGDPRLRLEDAHERPCRGGRRWADTGSSSSTRRRASTRSPRSTATSTSAPAATGPEVGEVVTIVPNHACGCTNLHDEVVVHRGGPVAGVWPVAARGKLR